MAYTPTLWTKNGIIQVARSAAAAVQFKYDGWQLTSGEYPPPSPVSIKSVNGLIGKDVVLTTADLADFEGEVTANKRALDAVDMADPESALRIAAQSLAINLRTPPIGAFVRALVRGVRGQLVTVQGDSTGTDPWEWVQTLFSWLASIFTDRTFALRTWNHATQSYDPTGYLRVGDAGHRYLGFTQGNGSFFAVPHSTATALAGDMDVRIKIALDDWTPVSGQTLASKNGSAGNRAWFWDITPTGSLTFTWSANGTDLATLTSTEVISFTDGQAGWLRFTFDADNGAGAATLKFYTSADGISWAQLGTDRTYGSVVSIFASTSQTQFLGRGGGGLSVSGKAYQMRVFASLASSAPVIDIDALMMPAVGGFIDFAGNAVGIAGAPTIGGSIGVMVLNASSSGQAVAYSTDPARFAKQVPSAPDLAFVSYSHNEVTSTSGAYATLYASLLDMLRTKAPLAGLICGTQNPQGAPRLSEQIAAHALRNDLVSAVAAAKGAHLIDVYRAFADDPRGAALVSSDGVHPTVPEGTDLWRDTYKAEVEPYVLHETT